MKRTRRRRIALFILLSAALAVCLFAVKILRPNILLAKSAPAWGVDVSEYQGHVDWQRITAQGVSFAYIKATEGSGYVDPRFAENRAGAIAAGLPCGAYHFFSFDSPAETQADSFLSVAAPWEGMLPPAIDLELYGGYKRSPLSREEVLPGLRLLIRRIEDTCGMTPILYVTRDSYRLYVREAGLGCPLWARDVYLPPLWAKEGWLLWQYTDRGRLDGYDGAERYIDLNAAGDGFPALSAR